MKAFCFFSVVFLAVGLFSVSAQDLIILKDGNTIEAKVTKISPTEIQYKRFDHLDGPTIVIYASDVLSIRYENGRVESIKASPANKFIFGINANAGGALGYIWGGPSGPGINIELGKGKFNSEINLMFPNGGFGVLFTFNGFIPSKIGGFYIGGGIGFSFYENSSTVSLPLGLNIGYKFVTKSGLYFRTGIFAGYDFFWDYKGSGSGIPAYIKPDLAIGWTMK